MKIAGYETKIQDIKAWLKTGSINIFGLPFAGKDTHGRELAKLLDGVFISSGDIFRSKDSPLHLQEHIGKGLLAPTEEFLNIVLPYFLKAEFKQKPLILSSVGRWHGEEAGVLEATAESGHPLLVVIYIKITIDEMVHRRQASELLGDRGKREDDAEHIIATRLEEFETKTKPVISFYKDQGMLIEIDGLKSRDMVKKDILDNLALRATASRPH
jgi:adenylate kinase